MPCDDKHYRATTYGDLPTSWGVRYSPNATIWQEKQGGRKVREWLLLRRCKRFPPQGKIFRPNGPNRKVMRSGGKSRPRFGLLNLGIDTELPEFLGNGGGPYPEERSYPLLKAFPLP